MRLRPATLLLLLFVFGRTSFATDTVSVRISHFGLEGNYASPAEPTWVEVTAHNNLDRSVGFSFVAAQVNLENDALPVSETATLPEELALSETRAIDVPLHIVPQTHTVLYVRSLDSNGRALGRTGMSVGQKINGQVIAMLCETTDLCRRGEGPPAYVAPLFFNPLYPLLSMMDHADFREFIYPTSSWMLFAAMGCLAAAFAMRRLKRGGDQL